MKRAYFAAAAAAVCAVLALAEPAAAAGKKIDTKADQYLREMSDFLANQKVFSIYKETS
jgi:hypothetical protein